MTLRYPRDVFPVAATQLTLLDRPVLTWCLQWLTYWTVNAFFTTIEAVAEMLINWCDGATYQIWSWLGTLQRAAWGVPDNCSYQHHAGVGVCAVWAHRLSRPAPLREHCCGVKRWACMALLSQDPSILRGKASGRAVDGRPTNTGARVVQSPVDGSGFRVFGRAEQTPGGRGEQAHV